MKLSVIVPAFKLAPYIHECLLSVLAQKTNFDFEVIVCDDTSPDNTFGVIAYLALAYPNLKVLRNEKNLGLIGTMRRLLESASGEYIAYLDGDDVALPGKLQQQVDYLDTHPGCRIVYHESDMFDSQSGDTLKFFSRDFYNYQYIPRQADITHLVKYTVFLQASSVMLRRYDNMTAALEHGNRIICDYPWHIMNLGLAGGTVDRIDQVLGRYRMHQNSFGGQTQRNSERRLQVTEELVAACRLGLRFKVDKDIVQVGVNHVYFSAALFFLKQRDLTLFQKMIEQSVSGELYFDKRHQMIYEYRADPDKVMTLLGWQS